MYKFAEQFDQLLEDIQPSKSRLADARTLAPKIRKHLAATSDVLTVEPHTRLIGSYPCHTAVHSVDDMKDVDVLLLVDSKYIAESPATILEIVRDSLDTFDDIDRVELKKQHRSVQVYFPDDEFRLDIVPGVMITNIDYPIVVPDRTQQEWKSSHPIGFMNRLQELNELNRGKVSDLIRLKKHWRDFQMKIMRPKSYWLSCLVVNYVQQKGDLIGVSFPELFSDLLRWTYEEFCPYLSYATSVPEIRDPVLNKNVAANWDRTHFETFMNRLTESVGWSQKAINDTTSEPDALKSWQKLFGEDWFVSDAKSLKASHVSPVTGAVTTAAVSASAKDMSLKPHRFYGGNDD